MSADGRQHHDRSRTPARASACRRRWRPTSRPRRAASVATTCGCWSATTATTGSSTPASPTCRSFLQPGDLLVANDSATLPAALTARRQDGSAIALHLSTRLTGGLWVVEPRKTQCQPDRGAGPAGRRHGHAAGAVRRLGAALGRPARPADAGPRPTSPSWGRPIAYPYVPDAWPIEMYQTVYASEPGSAEMPSAGRAFSPDVLARLAQKRASASRR